MSAVISDEDLASLMLGAFAASARFESFPIKVRNIEPNYQQNGQVGSFTLITESGLRYRMSVALEQP